MQLPRKFRQIQHPSSKSKRTGLVHYLRVSTPKPETPINEAWKPLRGEPGHVSGTRLPFWNAKVGPDSPPTAYINIDIFIYFFEKPKLKLKIS